MEKIKKKKSIVLIGTGGHAEACIELLSEQKIFFLKKIVGKKNEINKKLLNKYRVSHSDKNLSDLSKKIKYAMIGVGQIQDSNIRKKIFQILKKNKFILPTIHSKYSIISKFSSIGEGTVVMHGAIIGPGVKIGKNCIINSKVLIEHGSIIGDNTHIATSVTVNGNVKIGSNCFIGSGSVIRQNIKIKDNTFIKMLSVIKN